MEFPIKGFSQSAPFLRNVMRNIHIFARWNKMKGESVIGRKTNWIELISKFSFPIWIPCKPFIKNVNQRRRFLPTVLLDDGLVYCVHLTAPPCSGFLNVRIFNLGSLTSYSSKKPYGSSFYPAYHPKFLIIPRRNVIFFPNSYRKNPTLCQYTSAKSSSSFWASSPLARGGLSPSVRTGLTPPVKSPSSSHQPPKHWL